jgi:hypothetical protein
LATLAVRYRINSQLVYNQVEEHRGWSITDKISTVVKYMIIGGVMALLPCLSIIMFDSNVKFNDYLWIINLAFSGRDCLWLALPILITSLVWRTYLSPVSVMTLFKQIVTTVVRKLKPHSKKIVLGLLGIGVLVMLIPYLNIILFFGFLYLMRDIGLLDGEKDEEMELIDETGFMTKGLCYNYQTGKYDNGYEIGGIYDD